MLYRPDTWYAPGNLMARNAAAGLLPATQAITSFVHIDDAVAASVQALDWPDGAYNIVDDEPAATPSGRGATNEMARAAGWTPCSPLVAPRLSHADTTNRPGE